MPRVVSFFVLLGIVLLTGAMFFQVILQYVVPLFLAAVMVVIFQPLHDWVRSKLPERRRLAALATTLLVALVVLLPMLWLGWNSYFETRRVFSWLGDDQQRQEFVDKLTQGAQSWLERYQEFTGEEPDLKAITENISTTAAQFLLSSFQATLGLLVGLAIMMISFYYFLADGPSMIQTLMKLSPLEDKYERELLERFTSVSRSVVLASGLSALVQGVLAGVGYYFALPDMAPVFLLIAATMVLAIVPFVGAAAVWVPTCLLLYFYAGNDPNGPADYTISAIMLAVYCATVVSMSDNLVKPLVLHGQANLHPLLALLSILGGAKVLGPIGIIVGPMLVAFLQTLLIMLNKELAQMSKEVTEEGSPLSITGIGESAPPTPLPQETIAVKQAPAKTPEKKSKRRGKPSR